MVPYHVIASDNNDNKKTKTSEHFIYLPQIVM